MHYVYGYGAILDFIRTRASSYQTNKRLMFRSSKPAWALWQSDLLYAQALSSYKLMLSDFINKKTGYILYIRMLGYFITFIELCLFYRLRKVASSRLTQLVAHQSIFRVFIKGKFDAYVLWPLAKSLQNWIVDRSTAMGASNFLHFSFGK